MSLVFVEPAMRISTWRTLWPGRELQRRGHDVRIFAQEAEHRGELEAGAHDVILHVTSTTWMESEDEIATPTSLAHKFREYARRLYLTFDDDLTQLWAVNDDRGWRLRAFIADLPALCRFVDGVIVSTPRLADVYGRWAREVHVCENYAPRWVFDLPPGRANGRLGWMGTLEVHFRDLELLLPFAKDLPPLHLIGAGAEGVRLFRGSGADVTVTPPIYDQRRLYREMSACRAAVVPLVLEGPVGRFNAGKSWIKPMEFMVRNVPAVASAHPEYVRLPGAFTSADPAGLVEAAALAWEFGHPFPPSAPLLDLGLTMEEAGGDQWEEALGLLQEERRATWPNT